MSIVAERIFNLFLYIEGGAIGGYGARFHKKSGTDEEKRSFLLDHLDRDLKVARRFDLAEPVPYDVYRTDLRLGRQLRLFEPALREMRAPAEPFFCITHVVDGVVRIDAVASVGPVNFSAFEHSEAAYQALPDYLQAYLDGNVLDFSRMLNDDYFAAIKTLFNDHRYVSAAKLLMSAVDTFAFIEYGDDGPILERWLAAYVDLAPLGVSAIELREFRHSVLHMTNLDSRKVSANGVQRLMPYVGQLPSGVKFPPEAGKPLDLGGLFAAVVNGVEQWLESYSAQPEKLRLFVERYDKIISDSRVALFGTPWALAEEPHFS